MLKQRRSKYVKLLVLSCCVGSLGFATTCVDAAGVAGSYVGIGKAPDANTIASAGSEAKVESDQLFDYRQFLNSSQTPFVRVAQNNNQNGEGVDGNGGNDGAGKGNTAIGFGAYSARGFSTALGTYSQSIMDSTAIGAGTYASQNSAVVGRNAYASTSAAAMGDSAKAANGVAIGSGASAGEFYKYIQNDGNQHMDIINYSVAIGNNATAVGGTAIGAKASTRSIHSVALGQEAKVEADGGTALGVGAVVKYASGIALGNGSVADRGAGRQGYVPFADNKATTLATSDAALSDQISASDATKNFETTWSKQIQEYQTLNDTYKTASDNKEKQRQIMLATKGKDDAAYTAAKNLRDQYDKEAVAASTAQNNWIKANANFMKAMTAFNDELATFKATESAVSVGSPASAGKAQTTRQIINVAAGTNDTDAVNVAQLRRVVSETTKLADAVSTLGTELGNKADVNAGNITPDNVKRWKDLLGIDENTVGNVNAITLSEGDNVTIESTYNADKTQVNHKISVKDDAIKAAVKPELDSKANKDASNLNTSDINNWKDTLGVNDITQDVSKLNDNVKGLDSKVSGLDTQVAGLNDRVTGLDNRIGQLDQKIEKTGAHAAALAGLHPLEFNPDDKFSAAAALGSYKGESAVAIGGFYRPNADTMFSVSSTLDSDPMFNVGVSLKFGKKDDTIYRNTMISGTMASTNLSTLEANNKALEEKVASQQAQLEEQRALIEQLMMKVGI
ncbi:YadA-like family protein [Veillonella agrestimuris]|uniref:YadA-like family protein n=1 Tax=Veillonella agrestimuris TaxID=2941340 RepID=UPI00203D3274|nr:YadA-like family protein [Veillonella agrestimuris]